MNQKLKLIHNKHTGRHRPHEHTSHGLLVFMLLITGMVLAMYTYGIQAASDDLTGPHSESISLTGVKPEPPPETAATITSPADGETFSESPVTVEGTCPPESLVEILNNNIFVGSALCEDDGTYSVDIGLFIDDNELIARVYNRLNQPGPDSDTTTVFYDVVPPQDAPLSTVDFLSEQLMLNTDPVFRGTFVNETLTIPVEIIGGSPPFALDVRWGDNESKTVPRDSNQPFRISHTYTRPGSYQVNLQATDDEGRVAFLTTVVIINGQPSEVPSEPEPEDEETAIMGLLRIQWPILAATFAMVVSFWLGEQREKHLLARRGLLLNPPTQAKGK